MKKLFILIISSFLYLSNPFTIHINDHYTKIASNIFNINHLLKYDKDMAFKNINYLNQNKSISFDLNHKNNLKFLLKDKYNYLVSFDCYKYKYLILLKSKPIAYNYTVIDIDIRQDKQKRFIVLPYCNSKAEKFADRLKHLVESNFDQIDVKVAF
jgi:hypothetical protein